MNKLIYLLLDDVYNCYFYIATCKIYAYVKSMKIKGFVASDVFRAHDILKEYVSLYSKSFNIALVFFVNNYPHVWSLMCLNSEYTQCNCPIAMHDNIYKHVIKVLKMIHLDFYNAMLIRYIGTLHRTIEGG